MTAVGDVFRDVEHHRTGPPSRRDGEGAAHEFGDALNRLDPDQLLRGRAQNLHLPRFLGHVLPGMIAMAVAGDEHQRSSGVQRLDHAGKQVGGAGTEGRVANAHTAGLPWRRHRPRTRRSARRSPDCGRSRAASRRRRTAGAETRPCRTSADLVRDQHARKRLAAGHLHRLSHSPFLLVRRVQCRPPCTQDRVRWPRRYASARRPAGASRMMHDGAW